MFLVFAITGTHRWYFSL